MKSETLLTVEIQGRFVLAKLYKGEPSAVQYGNRTIAKQVADRVGGRVVRFRSPAFYVEVTPPQDAVQQ